MQPAYDGSSIEVLEGLEPVRRRPGMYTDTQNPNHLAAEVIDNAVDEALGGYADLITVTLHEDGSLSVEDNGRGMPVDDQPVLKVPAIELILGRLHAGGKFSSDNYTYSGGLHGVGVSVVNALSLSLQTVVKRFGKVYSISYAGGEISDPLHQIGTAGKKESGTLLRFLPDPKYFDEPGFDVKALRRLLQAKAVLCPRLKVILKDEKTGSEECWQHEGNLGQYLKNRLAGKEYIPAEPYYCKVEEQGEIEWALAFELEGTVKSVVGESYVNLIPTVEGGTHVNGFRAGILSCVREFCELHNLLPKHLKLTADDVWPLCSYVLSVKMHDPQFAGQTKERLSSRQCASLVENAVKDRLSLYLNANVEIGNALAKEVIARGKSREAAAKVVERKRAVKGPQLPGKLVDCTGTDPKLCELFIVEGDSAGGSARQARDAVYQAVLPLRGKILNTWEVSSAQALASDEIRAISTAMGIEMDSTDLSSLRYDKICILADADSDGLHIGTLLCALFVKHFTKLVQEGHVYVACPPLYRLDCGKLKEYALDDEELAIKQKQFMKKGYKAANIKIQRFKGLGEMNPEQLRETTLNPSSRRLLQLTLNDDSSERTFALMDMLLSKKRAQDRRSWLEDNGDKADLID